MHCLLISLTLTCCCQRRWLRRQLWVVGALGTRSRIRVGLWVCSGSARGLFGGLCSIAGFGVTFWRFVVVILLLLFVFDAVRRFATLRLAGTNHRSDIFQFVCINSHTDAQAQALPSEGRVTRSGRGSRRGIGRREACYVLSRMCLSTSCACPDSMGSAVQAKQKRKQNKRTQTNNKWVLANECEYSHTHTRIHWHSYSHSYMCASGLGHGSDWHKGTGGDQGVSISGTHSHASGVGTEWGLIMMTMTADCGWLCLLHG